MSKTLTFDRLQPEDRDTFQLEDGSLIEFRNRTDLDAGEQAQARKLAKMIEGLSERLERKPDDLHAQQVMRKRLSELIRIILPELPDELAGQWTAGQMDLVWGFWQRQQAERFDEKNELELALE